MECSNSLDNSRKKSRRVRSWYLYEQFKSLEKSQSDAAQRLKDKSYQERILYQELSERRARRRLCDQFGLCQSESRIDRNMDGIPSNTLLSSSTDDLYQSFCKLHGDNEIADSSSCDGSQSSKFDRECKTARCSDDASKENSATSVVQNLKFEDNLTDNVKEDLQTVQRNIAENINLQLETVKENIECIEKYAKLCEDVNISEDESFDSVVACECEKKIEDALKPKLKNTECNLFVVWSKLVTFSYNLMQMSSGNCYNDYSTQLLTAVLACDILRRALNKMSLRFSNKICSYRKTNCKCHNIKGVVNSMLQLSRCLDSALRDIQST
ncbi:uncharacterized protein LOC119832433 [Zerene cesonia]|uniref:uncharacterized protein LOC119832433 n=1 Tax=Zerene cesonia TaxID=33412 RepID=UPI0018E5A4EC|nr:uncharacterized protein LOC119832433 [Zerene cesonia]